MAATALESTLAKPAQPVTPARPRDYFDTAHLNSDLKGRSVRGGAATVATQAAKFLVKLASVPIMARLLTPEDFGLVAMVTAVTGFVEMFKDAGLSTATIQRAEINHDQVSTLFWINVAISLVLVFFLLCLAPCVAWFYGEPRLTWITVALAVTLLLGGLGIQHEALLRRQMRFSTLGAIEVAAQTTGIVAAIIAAALGAAYWAIVLMGAVAGIASVVFLWVTCSWRPGLPKRGCGTLPLLVFGANLTAASFLVYVRRNLDNFLIGFAWGPAALGVYTKAYGIVLQPIRQVNVPISAVLRPSLSRLHAQPRRFRRFYSMGLETIVFCTLPIVVLALVAIENVVLIILGEQWLECIPVFRALTPAMLMGTLNTAGGWLFVATGRTDKLLRANMVSTLAVSLAFLLGIRWGPVGVATAFSASFCLVHPCVILYACKETPVAPRDVVSAVWRPMIASAIAGTITVIVTLLTSAPTHPASALLVQIVSFSCSWIATILLLPGGAARTGEMLQLLKEQVSVRAARRES